MKQNMLKNYLTFICFTLFFLTMLLVLYTGSTVYASQDQDIAHENVQAPALVSINPCDGCESQNNRGASTTGSAATLSPEQMKLREARKAGDINTIRTIESNIKASVSSESPGESAGKAIRTESSTIAGFGTPLRGSNINNQSQEFSGDVHVRGFNTTTREWNQDLVSDSDGNLYVAWQDNGFAPNDYIQLYKSSDNGLTWTGYGYVQNLSASLSQPSIAIGQGANDTLIVAYIIDDGTNIPHVETATNPLGTSTFTVQSVSYFDFWESYSKPVVVTDSVKYNGWYAYLTAEATYSAASQNINVVFWRSVNNGIDWTDPPLVPYGNSDTEAWIDPDVTFGTNLNEVYIAVYNDTTNNIHTVTSADFGFTFPGLSVVAFAMAIEPAHSVDPDIEASLFEPNIMLVCTKGTSGTDVIGQGYSTNNGISWTTLWNLDGFDQTDDEFAPELTANEGGNSWHVAYTRSNWFVRYNNRPQDLSAYWSSSPDTVNDVNWASAAYPKKGISSDWTSDVATIAWADFRENIVGDYDTYADNTGFLVGEPIISITPTQLDFVQTENTSEFMEDSFTGDKERSQAIKVGDEETVAFSPSMMEGESGNRTYTFNWPNASYISIHFTDFDLADGEYVEVTSPEGTYSYHYEGKGKVVRNGEDTLSTFWASHIPGDTAVIKFINKGGGEGSFTIDRWVHGYDSNMVADLMSQETTPGHEAICGNDDKDWAPCHTGTEMYDRSQAVARLLINGSSACTGWLLGSEGHLVTNEHCISSQATADNTDYEFLAEGATCLTDCSGWFACSGTVEASSGTLVQDSASLDYALVLLPSNITGTYGFLQLRDTLPDIAEQIYIPQHPGAKGKQIGVVDDQAGGDFCRVLSNNGPACAGGPGDIEYTCDTEGGSSGSPVIAASDNLVVALHHCRGDFGAGCGSYDPNRGVPIPSIITDLGTNLPNDAIGDGGGANQTFTINNTGTTDLTVLTMSKRDGDPWFSFSPAAPFTVIPGASQIVTVTIDWDLVPLGFNDDQIIVTSDDTDLSPYPNAVFITADKLVSLPPMTLQIIPDATTFPVGTPLGYTVSATNNTLSLQCASYWTNLKLPDSSKYPVVGELYGPLAFCLNPGQTGTIHVSHSSVGAPSGTYTHNAFVGSSYPTPVWDEDHFVFTLTP